MTSEKIWYPSYLIDEILPNGKPSAEAWLPFLTTTQSGRTPMFGPGDVAAFRFVERRGHIEVSINPDGTHGQVPRCAATPDMFDVHSIPTASNPIDLPQEANSFWDHEAEIWAETLDKFARDYAANWSAEEPTTVVIDTAYWSPKLSYRISDDCKSLTLLPDTDNAESAKE